MSEESIIKRKLIFDGDGTGEDKKILTFVKLLPKWVLSGDGDTARSSEATYNKLLSYLQTIITNRKKLELINKSNTTQMELFTALQTTYQEHIKDIKKEIEKQNNLLQRAKIVKQNYVECNLLVDTVNRESSRKEMRKKIEGLEENIQNLKNEKENLDQKLNSKVKQCYVLSTSANALKGILKEENIENQMDTSSMNSENSEVLVLD